MKDDRLSTRMGGLCVDPELIVLFSLGLLDEAAAGAVRPHLATCDRCRIEVEAMRRAVAASFAPSTDREAVASL